jgi:2-iminoacetate synthase
MSEKELLQLICAWRLFRDEIEISISTREREQFRNVVIPYGVTTMSAGSRTNPGGYTLNETSLEQFEIEDSRTPAEISVLIESAGYKPVWKDWEVFQTAE